MSKVGDRYRRDSDRVILEVFAFGGGKCNIVCVDGGIHSGCVIGEVAMGILDEWSSAWTYLGNFSKGNNI